MAGRSGPAAGMDQGRRGRRDRVPTSATTRSGRTRTVSAGSAARARRPAGAVSPARRTSIQPASGWAPGPGGVPVPDVRLIRTRTRPCPRQKPASPASGRRAVSTAGRPARMASSRTGAPSPADTSGLGIRPPNRSAGGMPDGRKRRGDGCRAPALSRGVAVEPMAWQMRSLRTAAARAIRRTAAARSWPPVIAQPTRTAFFTRAAACGRRSLSYVSSRSSLARPVST